MTRLSRGGVGGVNGTAGNLRIISLEWYSRRREVIATPRYAIETAQEVLREFADAQQAAGEDGRCGYALRTSARAQDGTRHHWVFHSDRQSWMWVYAYGTYHLGVALHFHQQFQRLDERTSP